MWPLSQNPGWAASTAIWSTRTSLARMDTLHVPLQALGRWAEEHTTEVLAAREAYDTDRR